MQCSVNVNKMNCISAAVQRIAKPGFQVNQVENSDNSDTLESSRYPVINLGSEVMVLTISSPFISPEKTPIKKFLKFIFLSREDFVQLPLYVFACEF